MEFECQISRPKEEVVEIFENLVSYEKWKYTLKMTLWPNIKCDALCCVSKVPYEVLLKSHGISLFYHGKVMEFPYFTMEKSWNVMVQ